MAQDKYISVNKNGYVSVIISRKSSYDSKGRGYCKAVKIIFKEDVIPNDVTVYFTGEEKL